MLYQMIYSSRATGPLSAADLEQILVDARRGNEARDVTGALIYADGLFVQVLEGEHDVLVALVESIREDTRHDSMKVFHEVEIPQRAFRDWRMAWLDTDLEEMSRWAGLQGAGTVDALVDHVHREPERVPGILVRILEAIARRAERPGPG